MQGQLISIIHLEIIMRQTAIKVALLTEALLSQAIARPFLQEAVLVEVHRAVADLLVVEDQEAVAVDNRPIKIAYSFK